MPAILTPSRTERNGDITESALAAQLRVWQERWQHAVRQSGGPHEGAELAFAIETEPNWQRESPYYDQMCRLANDLGAETIDVRNEGAIDKPQEFAAAVIQIIKRVSKGADNLLFVGQNPTANTVQFQNDRVVDPVKAEETPAFLRSVEEAELTEDDSDGLLSDLEKAALAEAKKLYGPNKDYTHLMQHIGYAMREGFSPEEANLYVGARIEEDSIASGRGSPEMAAALMRQLQERINEGNARLRYAPPVPADTL